MGVMGAPSRAVLIEVAGFLDAERPAARCRSPKNSPCAHGNLPRIRSWPIMLPPSTSRRFTDTPRSRTLRRGHESLDLRQDLRPPRGVPAQICSHRRGQCLELVFGAALPSAVGHLVVQPVWWPGEELSNARRAGSRWRCRGEAAGYRPLLSRLFKRRRLARLRVFGEHPSLIVPHPIPLKGWGRWDDETHAPFAALFLSGGLDDPFLPEPGQRVLDGLHRHARCFRNL